VASALRQRFGLSVATNDNTAAAVGTSANDAVAIKGFAAGAIREAHLPLTTTPTSKRVTAPVINFATGTTKIGTGLRCTAGAHVALAHFGGLATAAIQLGTTTVIDRATVDLQLGAGLRRASRTYVADAYFAILTGSGAARQCASTAIGHRAAVSTFGFARCRRAHIAEVVLASVASLAIALVRATGELTAATVGNRATVVARLSAGDGSAGYALVAGTGAATCAGAAVAGRTCCAGVVDLAALGAEFSAHLGFDCRARTTNRSAAVIRKRAALARGIVSALLLGAHATGVRDCIADLTRWACGENRR